MLATGTAEELLRKTEIFGSLNDAVLQELASFSRRRTYKRGTDLFHEGDTSQTLFIIVSGYVNICQTRGQETVHIARCGAGEVFGELAALDGQPRSADATTDTECQLLMLDRVDIKRFVLTHPEVAWQLVKVLSARLRETSDRLVETETSDALGKIAAVLITMAKDIAANEKGHILMPGFSDAKVAERIGMTRETVNRRMGSLRQMGVVRREGRTLVVINQAKLLRLAERR